MAVIIKEIRVVATVTRDFPEGKPLSDEDLRRLKREIVAELKQSERHHCRNKNDDDR